MDKPEYEIKVTHFEYFLILMGLNKIVQAGGDAKTIHAALLCQEKLFPQYREIEKENYPSSKLLNSLESKVTNQ